MTVPVKVDPPTDPNKVDPPNNVVVDSAAALRDQAILTKLREQDELIRAQQAQLDDLKKKPDVPIDAQNKEFWNNPLPILRKELQETVAPLIEFRKQFQANSDYESIKNEAKDDPKLKDFLAQPGVERQIDQLMAKNPSPTREAFGATVMGLKGAMELGFVAKPVVPSDPNKPPVPPIVPQVDMTLPPHMRPSAAPLPSAADQKPKLRELNENERRLARENKLTEAEYIELTDNVKPLEVITWASEAEKAAKKQKEGAK